MEDNFTIIPKNDLLLGNLDDSHLENIFAKGLETLAEGDKLGFLAKNIFNFHLREVKHKANDSHKSYLPK
eukprot:5052137-Ditylum_brightwellii.AAC.1